MASGRKIQNTSSSVLEDCIHTASASSSYSYNLDESTLRRDFGVFSSSLTILAALDFSTDR
ncbi:hypothetical protein S1OALGB6SA_2052 [Olavius algarvensis spirochete endosymbiont]|nr:hypothetical protein S1OALGB6SA_2052 [Olavius algarvensis spirochete endosymbiont]